MLAVARLQPKELVLLDPEMRCIVLRFRERAMRLGFPDAVPAMVRAQTRAGGYRRSGLSQVSSSAIESALAASKDLKRNGAA